MTESLTPAQRAASEAARVHQARHAGLITEPTLSELVVVAVDAATPILRQEQAEMDKWAYDEVEKELVDFRRYHESVITASGMDKLMADSKALKDFKGAHVRDVEYIEKLEKDLAALRAENERLRKLIEHAK